MSNSASIEPHSYECGNFVVAEFGRAHAQVASIEPHSYECGNAVLFNTKSAALSASIEPHSYECGNSLETEPLAIFGACFN